MKLPDKIYDILKWIIVIVMPAIGTALVGLGQLFNWEWAAIVVQVMVIVETMLGSIFAISAANYKKTEDNDIS